MLSIYTTTSYRYHIFLRSLAKIFDLLFIFNSNVMYAYLIQHFKYTLLADLLTTVEIQPNVFPLYADWYHSNGLMTDFWCFFHLFFQFFVVILFSFSFYSFFALFVVFPGFLVFKFFGFLVFWYFRFFLVYTIMTDFMHFHLPINRLMIRKTITNCHCAHRVQINWLTFTNFVTCIWNLMKNWRKT